MRDEVIARFHQVHGRLRTEIHGLDSKALNWVPIAGANSIATILTHLVGSEGETFRCVAGLPSQRDRDAEFVEDHLAMETLHELLERADELIVTVTPRIDSHRLEAVFSLPTLPPEEVHSGLSWLVGNYGHACEHLGQIQLTKQLYQMERRLDS